MRATVIGPNLNQGLTTSNVRSSASAVIGDRSYL